MKPRTLWNERFGVLIAGAGAGSTLAYALGQTLFGANLLQRVTAADDATGALHQPNGRGTPKRDVDVSAEERRKSWMERAFDRLETWSWEREMRRREAYLAKAQDLADLENRMRELDRSMLSRGRALR